MTKTYRQAQVFSLFSLFLWTIGACTFSSLLAQSTYQKVHISLPSDYSEADIQLAIQQELPFVQDHRTTLEFQHQATSPGGTYWTYQQALNGIPIHQAFIKATVNRQQQVIAFMNAGKNTQTLQSPEPFVLDSAAVRRVLPAIWGKQEVEIAPIYLAQQDQLIPVYEVKRYTSFPPFAEGFMIDARLGTILSKRSLVANHHPAHPANQMQDTTGYGHVFNPDPCTAGRVEYGVDFSDNNDADQAAFYPLLDTVVLQDITYRNGTFFLEGPYVLIKDLASFNNQPATTADGKFFYSRDQSEFEDVMAYYHIDTFQRYVQSLGFTNLFNKPIQTDPHGYGDSDQSGFIGRPTGSELRFGDGAIDDAEDADVIIHEYGHALSYAASPNSRQGNQREGLDEGICDYFAASYSAGISDWQSFRLFNWDGNNPPFWTGRAVFTKEVYDSTQFYNIYEIGTFWCSATSMIREALGREVADKLQLQELYGNVPQMSLKDAALLYIDADSMLYGGIHTPTIRQYFCLAGILPADAQCTAVSTEPSLAPAASSWIVYPNPAKDLLYIQWQSPLPEKGDRLEILDVRGRILLSEVIDSQHRTTKLPLDLGTGLYILRYTSPKSPPLTQPIQIIR